MWAGDSFEYMKIVLNGELREIARQSAHSIRKALFRESDLIIRNGFQREDDFVPEEMDELFIISKGTMPPQSQLEAMLCARHTPKIHARLKKAKVAIAGLGGLGSNIAVALARTGIGELLLADFDVVEPSNLNRQHYGIRHLGMKKTQALRMQIEDINPYVSIRTMDVKVDEDNVVEIFRGYSLVCEAFDSPKSKAMLIETLLSSIPDVTIVSGSGMAGYESGNSIQTIRKMKRLYVCGDGITEAKEGYGLMMPRVQICAGHQANMVIRLILGIEDV